MNTTSTYVRDNIVGQNTFLVFWPCLKRSQSMVQVDALLSQEGVVAKTQLLKDKKGRIYVAICHPDSTLNCKLLSSRLGVGKGGIKEAEAVLAREVLGSVDTEVQSSSCITLASILGCQYHIGVLLDQNLTVEFWIGAAHANGSIYLDAIHVTQLLSDRHVAVIDFAADPKIDRENPPDLRAFADSLDPLPAEVLEAASAQGATNGQGPASSISKKNAKGSNAKQSQSKSLESASTAMDVNILAKKLIEIITQSAGKDEETKRRTQADIIMQLNILRNSSYAAGFCAAKTT